jgi:hypothetical protein
VVQHKCILIGVSQTFFGETAVDNAALEELLRDATTRQFWLKPVGLADRPIIINGRSQVRFQEEFAQDELEVRFTRNADEVRDGDLLIMYRVGVAAVMYVAERLPRARWTTPEDILPDGVTQRYPEWFKARNVTPNFSVSWWRFPAIKPFTLAKELNPSHSDDPTRLGRLYFRSDRARIPVWFAEELIRRIERVS